MYIVDAVLDPLAIVWLLLAGFIAVAFYRRAAAKFAFFLFLLLFLISSPVVVNSALYLFEARYRAMNCVNNPDLPIVILGGGLDIRATVASDIHYMSEASLARAFRGIELAKKSPEVIVYLSGGKLNTISEAEVTRYLLMTMGIPATQIVLEDRSLNTHENAVQTSKLLIASNRGGPVRLVTSAVHMPRAKAVFTKEGVGVCPAASNYLGNQAMPKYALIPNSEALVKMRTLIHELIGWWYYKARGWL